MVKICPHCGTLVDVKGLGRKRLNIPLKNILECLIAHRNVLAAARELNCSPGYIFQVLKENGLRVSDVIKNG